MADTRTTLFADAITEAQVAHGVARITLCMTGPDGKAQPNATLCVPVTQLPALVNGLANLMKQIEERVRAHAAQQQAATPVAEGAPALMNGSANSANLLKQIEERMQAQGAQQQPTTTAPAADATPEAGSFRFNN